MLGISSDELKSILSELIRVGKVTSTNDETATARVQFADRDDVVSYNLPVLVKNTLKNKDYWMPDINEQVLCLFLPVGVEQGWIIGSFYTSVVTPPQQTKNVRDVLFEDGTSVKYNRESHTLTIDVPADAGNVIINTHTNTTINTKTADINATEKATVNSPLIDLGESAALEPSVLGDKLASWIESELKPWLDGHKHPTGSPFTGTASEAPTGPFVPGSGANGGAVYSTKNKNQ